MRALREQGVSWGLKIDQLDLISVPITADITICFPMEHQDNTVLTAHLLNFTCFSFSSC